VKITKLTAENVKRLSAVEVTPDGNLVVVGGANAHGKSSVLDSIMYALAGATSIPSQPIRTGAKNARIVLDLDGERSLTVERTLGPKGGSLVVTSPDKATPFKSPQALLDSLCGKIAFDPLEFSRLKPREQMERLRDLVQLDFAELDRQREEVFSERTRINRDAKAMKARIDAMPVVAPDLAKHVDVSALMEELKRRQDVNAGNKQLWVADINANSECKSRKEAIDIRSAKIADLEQALAEAQEELGRLSAEHGKAQARAAAANAKAKRAVDLDTAEVEDRISSADAVNTRIRARQERGRCVAEHEAKVAEAEKCSDRIFAIDADKQKQIKAATWPVPGLGFDEDGVTYRGLPFIQASSAEMLKVSIAIGAAFNPVLRVMLIRDGSLLDAENLATIAGLAEERDLQLWIERVGDGDECSIVIEDGHVREEKE